MVRQHTQQPITTGASVLGFKYKDGVIIACDTMVSYGNTLKFPLTSRVHAVGAHTVVGASGEYSDFQAIKRMLDDREEEDWVNQDGTNLGPKGVASYLGRVLYNRRSKVDPLWNQLIIGGYKDGQHQLTYVDLQGTQFDEDFIATGFGMHIAIPVLRAELEDGKWRTKSEQEARAIMEKCLKLLFYRDCKASCQVQICVMDKDGVKVGDPYRLETFWEHNSWARPGKANTTQSW